MTGDSLQANHIEELRYQAAMDLETEMLNIRESLRLQLTEKTPLKNEEVVSASFMMTNCLALTHHFFYRTITTVK